MPKEVSFKKGPVSRRKVLTDAGLFLGATALAVLPAAAGGQLFAQEKTGKKSTFPWGYKKIDPEKAGQIAYEKYFEGECSYATASGILIPLQQEIGEPYSSLPLKAFRFGHSGVVGWGTTCGTLIGAGIATAFIAGDDGEQMLNEVMQWYTDTSLPKFEPSNPKATIHTESVSHSPLCHISVGRWMEKAGVTDYRSAPRKERCARLAGRVAKQTAIILNKWAEGKLGKPKASHIATYGLPAQNNCTDCHSQNIPSLKK
ncbi:MAG: C-GCAxxG-C-C family (seleno)protein [Candidatus Zixiibacteriota bacterium]|jgi:hypothetical protein